MTNNPAIPLPTFAAAPEPSSVPQRTAAVLHCWLMTALGLLIAGIALYDLRLAQHYEFLRTPCLVAEIIAGCGAAFCFGGAMHYVDVARTAETLWDPVRWYWKILFFIQKRFLMLLQLVLMAGALASVGALILGWKIPGLEEWMYLPR